MHQRGQLCSDRQPEAGATEATRRRGVGLRERLEDRTVLMCRDPDARVAHREAQLDIRRHEIRVAECDRHHDLARGGELDRVLHQVDQDLSKPPGIADDQVRNVIVNVEDELEPLLVRVRDQAADQLRELASQ